MKSVDPHVLHQSRLVYKKSSEIPTVDLRKFSITNTTRVRNPLNSARPPLVFGNIVFKAIDSTTGLRNPTTRSNVNILVTK